MRSSLGRAVFCAVIAVITEQAYPPVAEMALISA
ncbi:Uncharacterised protein [Vibrio cholerae]|nr:Uncharacterised protein [Vibrio cholerae]